MSFEEELPISANQKKHLTSPSSTSFQELDLNEDTQSSNDKHNISNNIGILRKKPKEDGSDGDGGQKRSLLRRVFIFFEFPIAIWFIIGNEFCERFSFYGFKAILPLYLHKVLEFNPDQSTAIVHTFIFFAYFTSFFGAFLADSLIGKFWTISLLSIVYCIGQVFVSVTAIPNIFGNPPHWLPIAAGLLLVSIGTGGIKPCVSSFGGDQFKPTQKELITSYFSLFYFSINLGSTISSFLTPILRDYFGYAIAFAVPAGLLLFATFIFIIGKRSYKNVPAKGNVYIQFFRVIGSAIRNFRNPAVRKVDSWLDRAKVSHPQQSIDDVKATLHIVIVMIPILFFWTLYDQHATRWVFQAKRMNRYIFGYEIAPEQIVILNPLLIITMVPLCDRVIFRLIQCCFDFRPLRKVGVGFLVTMLSFLVSAGLEFLVASYPNQIHISLQIPQFVILAFGEILVSVTGLDFAYKEAPKSMKSIMQSVLLMTVAGGNLIVVIVASISSEAHGDEKSFKQAYEFLFFSGLILCAFFLFSLISYFYKYRKVEQEDDEEGGVTHDEEKLLH